MTSSNWKSNMVLQGILFLVLYSALFPSFSSARRARKSYRKKKSSSRTSSSEDDAICKGLMKGSDSNKMNILLAGLLTYNFLLVTNDFYVYDLPPASVRGDENSTKLYLGNAKPVLLDEKWPILAKNDRFKRIRKEGIYNAFTVRDDESEYVLFITWLKVHGSLTGVTYDVKNNKILNRGFRFKNDKKQVMISSSEKMLFYALRDRSDSGKLGLHMSEFTFNASVLSKAGTMNRNGPWMALCSEEGGKMYLIKGNSSGKSCDPVEWKNVIKGFIDSDQVFLFGSQYIYLFDLNALTSPGTRSTITKKRYDAFYVCHPDYVLWAIILIALLFLLLLLLILIWLCCCRNKRKKKNTNDAADKSKKSKKRKPKSGMGRAAQPTNNGAHLNGATEQMSRRSKKSVKKPGAPATSGYKSTGPNALTRRSKGGTRKSMKKSKSNKPTSKYNSYAHDGTGRSVFKQKQ